MILLHNEKIAIMTPPKCATNTLHAALRGPPWLGETFVGPSPASRGLYDRHLNIWPGEAKHYKKVVVVRSPFSRLVSLYLHYGTRILGYGNSPPDFGVFVQMVITGGPFDLRLDGGLEMFGWNLSTWLRNVEYDSVIKVESLLVGLQEAGLLIRGLPNLNKGYLSKDYELFYNDTLYEWVKDWAMPDCDKFEYEWPR